MNPKLTCLCLLAATAISLPAQTATPPPAAPAPAAAAAPAAPAAPTSPVSMPAMTGPLTVNVKPTSFNVGSSPIYVSGVASGLFLAQGAVLPGDRRSQFDMSNAQVFIQKVDGPVQFFGQFGEYSLPSLGAAYFRAGDVDNLTYGYFPQGFIKLVPTSNFSIVAGKLPTLIGAEYTFTFENMNIERGLLWNQENAVNNGVQANFTAGPVAFSASVNDGFYSRRYSWLWGSAAVTINSSNTLAFIAGGNLHTTRVSTFVTPALLNNEQIFNVIYTHLAGAWTFTPYLQYTSVPRTPSLGSFATASTFGMALLANYTFDDKSGLSGWSLPFRIENIASHGSAAKGAPNLLYGNGSSAWSVTLTPTYQYKLAFLRLELSYVGTASATPGFLFGPNLDRKSQGRFLIETGVLF